MLPIQLNEVVINGTTNNSNIMDKFKQFFTDNSAWILIGLTAAAAYAAYALDWKRIMKK